MADDKVISSIEDLDGGREAVDEVVIVQQRPPWSSPLWIVVFLVVHFIARWLDVGALLGGAMAGGALGIAMVATSTRWLLAATPTRVLLARAKPWSAGTSSIEAESPRGVEMTAGRSFINATYTLDGRTFVVSRAHTARLGSIATLR